MAIPITLLAASLLGIVFLVIALRNAAARGRVMAAEKQGEVPSALAGELDHRLRVVANFAEYVPLALILLAALEMSSLDRLWVATLAALLVLGRILHAWGYSRSRGPGFGRFVGTAFTWVTLLAGCGLGLYTSLFA